MVDLWLFYLFAALTVTASLLVIARRNPMHSVLLLILSFVGLAGLYILLDSPFAAVSQIIVYAGAIMVLFLFVIMLLSLPDVGAPAKLTFSRVAGAGATVGLLAALLLSLRQLNDVEPTWTRSAARVAEFRTAWRFRRRIRA